MLRVGVLFVLASLASAGDRDAAIAPPHRWSDPNGTPAGTRRSACLPLTSDVEEAWHVDLPGRAVSPLVYWEREAFVACRDDDRYVLVAVDVLTGEITARATLPQDAPPPLPVVWEGRVYVRVAKLELGEYQRSGRTLQRRWVHKPAEQFLSDAIVHENEIYAVADGTLLRLRPRWKSPIWTAGNGNLRGRPALYGDHVYVLLDAAQEGSMPSMHVAAYQRRDGRHVVTRNGAWYHHRDPPVLAAAGGITVTEKTVILRGAAPLATRSGAASHVMLDRDAPRGGGLSIGKKPPGLMNYPVEPAVTPLGVLVLAKAELTGWALLANERRYRVFTTTKDNPDLFDGKTLVAPTVLGDIVYFGSWAADLRTYQVLWRLPVKRLSFPAVPLDGMVMVVDSGTRLRAFRARGTRP